MDDNVLQTHPVDPALVQILLMGNGVYKNQIHDECCTVYMEIN